MIQDVTVPSVGESISEGVLAVWTVKDGGYVKKGETLFELETDKASSEVPAPESGTVHHKVGEGETVAIGDVVGSIDTEGKETASGSTEAPKDQPKGQAQEPAKAGETAEGERIAVTSLARKVADELGVSLEAIKGTGHGGRITREDVESAAKSAQPAKPAPAGKAPAPAPAPSVGVQSWQGEVTRERMSTLRKRIAERLVEAQHTAAMLTTFNDVDMGAVMALRNQYKDAFKDKHGVGLGFMSFFTKAAVEALREFPKVNAMIDGNEMVTFHSQHIGVAVSTEKGLVVPVLRNADKMSFAEIEAKIREFAAKARDGKIELSDMTGGTFTITNGGVFGSMLSTPILNPPQSAILGMHRIEDRPVARDGQVVIRPMMYLAVSYDHRIIDGREAVSFLARIKDCLENPARMLLGV